MHPSRIDIRCLSGFIVTGKIVEKIKEAKKETLTLADRIDMINSRYERLQNILSKLGVDEITALSVEQRKLNEVITNTCIVTGKQIGRAHV